MACTCGAVVGGACPPGQKHLRYYYSGSAGGTTHNSYYDVCVGRCNPLACSNAVCTNQIGCVGARAQFCKDWGKSCPGKTVKQCYGPQGQDPCPGPADCSFKEPMTADNAANKIVDYVSLKCGMTGVNGAIQRANAKSLILRTYTQGLSQIVSYWKSCSLTAANKHIIFVGDAFRCAQKCDPAIRGKCDTNIPNCSKPPICQGDPGTPVDCNENPTTWGRCLGQWWKDGCHAFDFLPLGGCNTTTQTVVFVGGIALGLVLLFTLLKR